MTLPVRPWQWQQYRDDLARRVQLCSLLGRLFFLAAFLASQWLDRFAGIASAALAAVALCVAVRGLVLLRELRRL